MIDTWARAHGAFRDQYLDRIQEAVSQYLGDGAASEVARAALEQVEERRLETLPSGITVERALLGGNDAELLAWATDVAMKNAIEAGWSTRYHTLVKTFSGQLFGVVYRILGDAALAEETVQETFRVLHQKRHESRLRSGKTLAQGLIDGDEGAIRAWTTTVARHLALDEVDRPTPDAIEDDGGRSIADVQLTDEVALLQSVDVEAYLAFSGWFYRMLGAQNALGLSDTQRMALSLCLPNEVTKPREVQAVLKQRGLELSRDYIRKDVMGDGRLKLRAALFKLVDEGIAQQVPSPIEEFTDKERELVGFFWHEGLSKPEIVRRRMLRDADETTRQRYVHYQTPAAKRDQAVTESTEFLEYLAECKRQEDEIENQISTITRKIKRLIDEGGLPTTWTS